MIDSKENHKCWRNFPHQKAEATSALTCLDLLLSRFLHLFLFLDVWQGKTQAITKDKKRKRFQTIVWKTLLVEGF